MQLGAGDQREKSPIGAREREKCGGANECRVQVAIVPGVTHAGADCADQTFGWQSLRGPAGSAPPQQRGYDQRVGSAVAQNGKSRLIATIARPPIAGPTARLTL